MKASDLDTGVVTLLVDPDGVSDPSLYDGGNEESYTYPDGEECVGYSKRVNKDKILAAQRSAVEGYFSMAWDDSSVWFIFDDRYIVIDRPLDNSDLAAVHHHAKARGIDPKYLSKKFVDHYVNSR